MPYVQEGLEQGCAERQKKPDYSTASVYLSTFIGHSEQLKNSDFTDYANVYKEEIKYLSEFLQNN